jgi:hypothetical protein
MEMTLDLEVNEVKVKVLTSLASVTGITEVYLRVHTSEVYILMGVHLIGVHPHGRASSWAYILMGVHPHGCACHRRVSSWACMS